MIQPLVSILIPVYNRETLIGPCIESALNQTIIDIEIIVVDNASTDNTWQVCQSYAEKDSRVRIFRNEQNIGPVRNWQRCIDEARGFYGKIIFSDDLIHAQYLEKTVPLMERQSVAFVFTSVCIGEQEWQGESFYRYRENTGLISAKEYIRDCFSRQSLPVSPGCALFRLEDLKNNLKIQIPSPTITDFDKHGAGPDLLLFLLTAINYENIGYVDETLVFFRSHPGSITISDKLGYLETCYFQARVWFAKECMDDRFLDQFLVAKWLFHRRKSKSRISYRAFAGQYLNETRKLSLQIVLIVKINSFLGKVKRKLKIK